MTERDEYRPRREDHLVEPMFAGLGVGEDRGEADKPPDEEEDSRSGFYATLARLLRRIFRPGR